jgi:hypothetical protein
MIFLAHISIHHVFYHQRPAHRQATSKKQRWRRQKRLVSVRVFAFYLDANDVTVMYLTAGSCHSVASDITEKGCTMGIQPIMFIYQQ